MAKPEWQMRNFWHIPGAFGIQGYSRTKWEYERWSPYIIVPRQGSEEFIKAAPLASPSVGVFVSLVLFAISFTVGPAWANALSSVGLAFLLAAIVKIVIEWAYRP